LRLQLKRCCCAEKVQIRLEIASSYSRMGTGRRIKFCLYSHNLMK
jgi:hypothetical protein